MVLVMMNIFLPPRRKNLFPDTTEPHIHFRHFDVDTDLPRLVQLLTRIEQVDHAGEDTSEETLKVQLTLPGHDPVQDRWVVTASNNEQLIGYSSVWKVPENNYADIYVAVHPDWRRQGIGSELLQRIVTRAQTHHPQDILVSADAQNQVVKDFLHKRAFLPISAYTAMRLASTVDLPQAVLPIGYTLRVYDPVNDFSLLLKMYNRAFQGLWGHWEHVKAENLHEWLEGMNPDGIFLLFTQTGDVVGTCRGEISEPLSKQRGTRIGYLDAPGVVPEHRSENLYLPQLLHIANWVREQERDVAIEIDSWGDDPQVLAQYQQVGFERTHQQDIYRWQSN